MFGNFESGGDGERNVEIGLAVSVLCYKARVFVFAMQQSQNIHILP